MKKENKITAGELSKQFLKERYINETSELKLRYFDKRFFAWRNGQYSEIDAEAIKLAFTSWTSENKISKNKFSNTKNNADEALHHIRTATFLQSTANGSPYNTFLDDIDERKYVAFKNGIVCVEDLLTKEPIEVEIKDESPLFFNITKIPYEFDPYAECPHWLSVINKILPNPEDQELLQQWFGYHLSPTLSRSKMMFFEGSGANGKSVVLLVLRLLLGEENVSSLPLSAFDMDKTFKLAVTEGKLANICEEVGPIHGRVEETIKQFVNGGAFTVEKKFKDPFTLYPSAKLTFATNELPSFNDRSNGLWRRLLYIKFPVKISAKDQNRRLIEKSFWVDSKELSGILNWAIEGAKRLELLNGFIDSKRKQDEINQICVNADMLRPWVQDTFAEGQEIDKVKSTEIMNLAQEAMASGYLPRVSLRDIFKEIQAQFPNSYRPANAVQVGSVRARVVCGIQLRSDYERRQLHGNTDHLD